VFHSAPTLVATSGANLYLWLFLFTLSSIFLHPPPLETID
jgi:hypothetical protein